MLKKRKYRNTPCVVDGISFHSKKEATRYNDLLLCQRAGHISNLILQPVFRIVINGKHVCKVIPDFSYIRTHTGELEVEDVKSPATRKESTYRLKKKLLEACHDIVLVEV